MGQYLRFTANRADIEFKEDAAIDNYVIIRKGADISDVCVNLKVDSDDIATEDLIEAIEDDDYHVITKQEYVDWNKELAEAKKIKDLSENMTEKLNFYARTGRYEDFLLELERINPDIFRGVPGLKLSLNE